MKKLSAILLSFTLFCSLTPAVMANNGKGIGIATAPGQSSNFSKGITTAVTTSQSTNESRLVDIQISEEVSTETKSQTSTDTNTTDGTITEFHTQQPWAREVTTTINEISTTTSTWDETISLTTTITTEIPVTATATTETTIMHRGAPISNGKVLSENSSSTISEIYGEPVVVTAIEADVISGDVTITTNTEIILSTIESEWIAFTQDENPNKNR